MATDRKEYQHQRYLKKKEEYRQKYLENREAKLKKAHENYVEKREGILAYRVEYHKKNHARIRAYQADYKGTQLGRASNLLGGYARNDRRYDRECTITREWIVDHIFSSSCVYCGESDWRKLGCDRKDNSIGHTPENCVPCCWDCNHQRMETEFHQYIGSLWSIQGRLSQRGSAETR